MNNTYILWLDHWCEGWTPEVLKSLTDLPNALLKSTASNYKVTVAIAVALDSIIDQRVYDDIYNFTLDGRPSRFTMIQDLTKVWCKTLVTPNTTDEEVHEMWRQQCNTDDA